MPTIDPNLADPAAAYHQEAVAAQRANLDQVHQRRRLWLESLLDLRARHRQRMLYEEQNRTPLEVKVDDDIKQAYGRCEVTFDRAVTIQLLRDITRCVEALASGRQTPPGQEPGHAA